MSSGGVCTFLEGANHHRILALRFSTMLKISRADTHGIKHASGPVHAHLHMHTHSHRAPLIFFCGSAAIKNSDKLQRLLNVFKG